MSDAWDDYSDAPKLDEYLARLLEEALKLEFPPHQRAAGSDDPACRTPQSDPDSGPEPDGSA